MAIQILTAFTLGLMTIIDPCTLFTSIAAVGYIDKEVANKRRVLTYGLMFVLGKVIAYSALSIPFLIGAQTTSIEHFIERYGEPVMAVFMLCCGIFMLFAGHLHHNHDHGVIARIEAHEGRTGWLWAMLLGMFFSVAFCPHRLIYFLTMLDIAVTIPNSLGWLMPIIFSLGTGLPILIIALVLSYSMMGIASLTDSVARYERWFRYICAVLFLIAGIFLTVHSFSHHEHQEHVSVKAVYSR